MGSFEKNKTNMNFHILGPAPPPPKTYEEQNLFFSIHNMSHPLMSKNVFGPTPTQPRKFFHCLFASIRTCIKKSIVRMKKKWDDPPCENSHFFLNEAFP